MLINGSQLINLPVMGLQTGTELGRTKLAIIDPSKLRIIAYEVDGPMIDERPSYILVSDVRELSNIGMIIDSRDEFVGKDDVISLSKILGLDFNLIGLNTIDEHRHRLGKVAGYNLDTTDFLVQQLTVRPGIIKSISEAELLIHRSQIIEINNREVLVKSGAKKLSPIKKIDQASYINPFRSPTPQTKNARTN
ncbi:hypothetical protein HGB24_02125 [Candidatus Saccharibacteria bacterium]|nr:hypothetical protein [Candidatus Saccharibacteria bacterium]